MEKKKLTVDEMKKLQGGYLWQCSTKPDFDCPECGSNAWLEIEVVSNGNIMWLCNVCGHKIEIKK